MFDCSLSVMKIQHGQCDYSPEILFTHDPVLSLDWRVLPWPAGPEKQVLGGMGWEHCALCGCCQVLALFICCYNMVCWIQVRGNRNMPAGPTPTLYALCSCGAVDGTQQTGSLPTQVHLHTSCRFSIYIGLLLE